MSNPIDGARSERASGIGSGFIGFVKSLGKHTPPKTSGPETSAVEILKKLDAIPDTDSLSATKYDQFVRDTKATSSMTLHAFKELGLALKDVWIHNDIPSTTVPELLGTGIGMLLVGSSLVAGAVVKILWLPTLLCSTGWGTLQSVSKLLASGNIESAKEGFKAGFSTAFEKTEGLGHNLTTLCMIALSPLTILEILGNQLIRFSSAQGQEKQAAERREKINYAIFSLDTFVTDNVFGHALDKAIKKKKTDTGVIEKISSKIRKKEIEKVDFNSLKNELKVLKDLGANFGSDEFSSLITTLAYKEDLKDIMKDKSPTQAKSAQNMQKLAQIIVELDLINQLKPEDKQTFRDFLKPKENNL